jgi:hypothetical protein
MKEQKEHPQRHNLVSHFLIRLLRLRMHTSCLEADKLVQEGEAVAAVQNYVQEEAEG